MNVTYVQVLASRHRQLTEQMVIQLLMEHVTRMSENILPSTIGGHINQPASATMDETTVEGDNDTKEKIQDEDNASFSHRTVSQSSLLERIKSHQGKNL
jgi:hypothetical protein